MVHPSFPYVHTSFASIPPTLDDHVRAAVEAKIAAVKTHGIRPEDFDARVEKEVAEHEATEVSNLAPIRMLFKHLKHTSEESIDRADFARKIATDNKLAELKLNVTDIFGPMRRVKDEDLPAFALNVERMAFHVRSPAGRSLHSPNRWILSMLHAREMFPAPAGFVSRADRAVAKERAETEAQNAEQQRVERARIAQENRAQRDMFDRAFVEWRARQTREAIDLHLSHIPKVMRGFAHAAEDAALRNAYATEIGILNPYDADVSVADTPATPAKETASSTRSAVGRAIDWLGLGRRHAETASSG